jgi:Protein of unknown function (DUF2384)
MTHKEQIQEEATDPADGSARAIVLTKAVLRAASHLKISNRALGRILGLSEATLSRMRSNVKILEEGSKAYELAALFVRFYRGLDAIVGGDDKVAAHWLQNENSVLNARPLDMIQTLEGLINAIQYVDARRAIT